MRAALKRLLAWMAPITPGARRAVVVLFAMTFLLAGASILFTVTYYQREQSSQQRQDAQQAADQRAQSAAFERKLCATLGRLASRKPPAGSPSDLSRAYLQWQWSTLAELGPDVGCGSTNRR